MTIIAPCATIASLAAVNPGVAAAGVIFASLPETGGGRPDAIMYIAKLCYAPAAAATFVVGGAIIEATRAGDRSRLRPAGPARYESSSALILSIGRYR